MDGRGSRQKQPAKFNFSEYINLIQQSYDKNQQVKTQQVFKVKSKASSKTKYEMLPKVQIVKNVDLIMFRANQNTPRVKYSSPEGRQISVNDRNEYRQYIQSLA